ncbi:pimeloyl-ACP methyl ester carboxylesterase [Herbihabitans rhizosphaerae]|uniref:Pimeloyl-ACP methyl ester carboxylesterase n=1 Tax=Herbihabitans rhizosphaerae TaxID=1872711 RepID=A0A4Q7L4N8_9PSEU|nr:pimeloyl-ACP methyl ester carboxylesterase [Herbihabitans rhizosphaerae]
MITSAYLAGAGGVRLAVHSAGDPAAPPIVFVHGWCASARAWHLQMRPGELDGFRRIAVDLRGHGGSSDPGDANGGYGEPEVWADDLAAVLAHAGAPAVVVGWSYGGLVIADYLARHGCAGLAGIALVGAITEIGRDRPGGVTGPAMRELIGRLRTPNTRELVDAFQAFTASSFTGPVPEGHDQTALADFLRVRPGDRMVMFRRDADRAEALASVTVPSLVMHGMADAVVDPRSGEYALGKIPGAEKRWFDAVGHLPFVEQVGAFDAELASFAGRCAR